MLRFHSFQLPLFWHPADFTELKITQKCTEAKLHPFIPGVSARDCGLRRSALATASVKSAGTGTTKP